MLVPSAGAARLTGGTGTPQLHTCPHILTHQALLAARHAGTTQIQEISSTFA